MILASFSEAHPKEITSNLSSSNLGFLIWLCIYDRENRSRLIKKGGKIGEGVLSE